MTADESRTFVDACAACIMTLDALSPEVQRRALAVLNAAFPAAKSTEVDWYKQLGGSTQQGVISGGGVTYK